MTDVAERPVTTASSARLKQDHGRSSIRLSLSRLTTLTQPERIRYGNMIESGDIALSDYPLTLNGDTLGDRKRQLRDWLVAAGNNPAVAEAIAGKLRAKVNYVHYVGPEGRKALWVETKTK